MSVLLLAGLASGLFVLLRLSNDRHEEIASAIATSAVEAGSVAASAAVYAGLGSLAIAVGALEAAVLTGNYAAKLDYEKLNEVFAAVFAQYPELEVVELGFVAVASDGVTTVDSAMSVRRKAADVCSAANRLGISIVSSAADCSSVEACSLGVTCQVPGEGFTQAPWFTSGAAALSRDFTAVHKTFVGPFVTAGGQGAVETSFGESLALAFGETDGLVARAVISALRLQELLGKAPAQTVVLTEAGRVVASNLAEAVMMESEDSLEFPVLWQAEVDWRPPQPLVEGVVVDGRWLVKTDTATAGLWTSTAVEISADEEMKQLLFFGAITAGVLAGTLFVWLLVRVALAVQKIQIVHLPDWVLNLRDWLRGY